MLDLSKLEANEKLLGIFPLKTSLYMLGDTGIDNYIKYQELYDTRFFFIFDYDELLKRIKPLAVDTSRFRKWLMYKAGEKPQLIDSPLIVETQNRINNYLYNRGYFQGTATYTIEYNQERQTGVVHYQVDQGTLYRMKNVTYEIKDPGLLNKIKQIPQKSLLATGQPIDVELLKSERSRLYNNLRNVGYYRFQKEYIYFEVDTASGTDSLDIYVRISNPVNDTVHHPFAIKDIYVFPNATLDYRGDTIPDFAIHYIDSSKVRVLNVAKTLNGYMRRDTTSAGTAMIKKHEAHEISRRDLLKYYVARDSSHDKLYKVTASNKLKKIKREKLRTNYYLINSPDNYTPKAIANNIFINPHTYYSDSLIQKTVASFSSLGIYKYVTIQAEEMWDSTSYLQFINLYLRLDPLPVKGISYEINANTTSDYLLGNSINLIYTQKNLFHGLEQFKFNVKGGIETQLGSGQAFINTSEFNVGTGISIPTFMWPIPLEVPKRYFPKTDLNLNFNYVNQVNDFTLFNTSFEYGVSVFENSKNSRAQKQHIIKAPIPTINIVRVPVISDDFKASLETNPLLKQSFEEVVITGYGYTFLRNTQPTGYHKVDTYLRTTTEINLPFSDFWKVDADYRVYLNLNKANHIALRAAGGFALPIQIDSTFLNTEVIPYVKQFFVGGAYSVRAFSVRKLGPGGFVAYDTTTGLRIDQVADMKLEFNVEYRFDIISILEGALFCDIGNTFTHKTDPFRPHTAFFTRDLFREFAVGPGAGLRLDFGYFVIRVDAAYPLYDPALDGPYAQEFIDYYKNLGFDIPKKSVAINLAIGYPF